LLSEKQCEDLRLGQETSVVGQGMNISSRIEMSHGDAVAVKSYVQHTFYVSFVNGTGIRLSLGSRTGIVVAQNEHSPNA
jgi:hypothetical protein